MKKRLLAMVLLSAGAGWAGESHDAQVSRFQTAFTAYWRHSMKSMKSLGDTVDPKRCATGDEAVAFMDRALEESRKLASEVRAAAKLLSSEEQKAASARSAEALAKQLSETEAEETAREERLRAFKAACPKQDEELAKRVRAFTEAAGR